MAIVDLYTFMNTNILKTLSLFPWFFVLFLFKVWTFNQKMKLEHFKEPVEQEICYYTLTNSVRKLLEKQPVFATSQCLAWVVLPRELEEILNLALQILVHPFVTVESLHDSEKLVKVFSVFILSVTDVCDFLHRASCLSEND